MCILVAGGWLFGLANFWNQLQLILSVSKKLSECFWKSLCQYYLFGLFLPGFWTQEGCSSVPFSEWQGEIICWCLVLIFQCYSVTLEYRGGYVPGTSWECAGGHHVEKLNSSCEISIKIWVWFCTNRTHKQPKVFILEVLREHKDFVLYNSKQESKAHRDFLQERIEKLSVASQEDVLSI